MRSKRTNLMRINKIKKMKKNLRTFREKSWMILMMTLKRF